MREDVFYLADELSDLEPFFPLLDRPTSGASKPDPEGTFTFDWSPSPTFLETILPPPTLPSIEVPVRRGKVVGKASLGPTILRPDGTFSVSVEVLEPRLITRKSERIRKRRRGQDLRAARRAREATSR
ncbi:MAG: hypothetical protein KGR26_14015 [Cyanobacteria bacterium REEB65]|nr:hypothetical protein [Cyanobacteria bacterium REEB65]